MSGRRLGAFSLRKIASSQPRWSPRCFWLISRHGMAASSSMTESICWTTRVVARRLDLYLGAGQFHELLAVDLHGLRDRIPALGPRPAGEPEGDALGAHGMARALAIARPWSDVGGSIVRLASGECREQVAWAYQRGSVVAATLVSLLLYLEFEQRGERGLYGCAIAAFLLSLPVSGSRSRYRSCCWPAPGGSAAGSGGATCFASHLISRSAWSWRASRFGRSIFSKPPT